MSERKVLQKYYPPDFDGASAGRVRKPKGVVAKLPTVRLMAPFSMRCTRCGNYIPKAKKFNARKEVPTDEKYLGIQKFRFYIRCPHCHGEICFMTDPKSGDYQPVSGVTRNHEPWRDNHVEETDEQTLARLEAEAAEDEAGDAMEGLETKMLDAQRDVAVADALDEIRAANARVEKAADTDVASLVRDVKDDRREREEAEDAEAARRAFAQASSSGSGALALGYISEEEDEQYVVVARPDPPPTFTRPVKAKKNFSAMLGIKKKT
jgi:hypothetical protein